MKKTAIALAVALAGFATVAQAAPKITPGTPVVNWAGPSIKILALAVSMATLATTVLPIKTNWVLVRSWVTKPTNTWALKWDTTGLAVCLTKATFVTATLKHKAFSWLLN